MNELSVIAAAGALAGAAVLTVGPLRRRVVPVTKAAGKAGYSLADAAVYGIDGIARAMLTRRAPGKPPKEPATVAKAA